MARVTATVEGLDRLRGGLTRLARGMTVGAEQAQLEVAAAIAADWRAGVPVDTGEYQRSIGHDSEGASAEARHAPFVEFGTSTHAAQPAGTVAAEAARTRMPGRVAAVIRRELP